MGSAELDYFNELHGAVKVWVPLEPARHGHVSPGHGHASHGHHVGLHSPASPRSDSLGAKICVTVSFTCNAKCRY